MVRTTPPDIREPPSHGRATRPGTAEPGKFHTAATAMYGDEEDARKAKPKETGNR